MQNPNVFGIRVLLLYTDNLLGLEVGVLDGCIEAGAGSIMTEVAMTYDDGAGVALMELFE